MFFPINSVKALFPVLIDQTVIFLVCGWGNCTVVEFQSKIFIAQRLHSTMKT